MRLTYSINQYGSSHRNDINQITTISGRDVVSAMNPLAMIKGK